MKSKGGSHNSINQGCVSGNKNGGGAVRLGLRFEGQNYQYFKTLEYASALFSSRAKN